ncbi:MAG: ATP-binding protein [Bacteroidales bacterium]|nr:ATP-binding protein [Bacteroidales bacterium]
MPNKLFTFGRPAKGEGFTDRQKETEKLVSNFRYGINTFIISPRRWGKTSLVLKAMEEASTDKLLTVFVDIFSCKNEEQFCEKLSTAVLSQTAGRMEEVMENAKSFLSRITFDVGLSPNKFNPFDLKVGLSGKEHNLDDVLMLPQKIAEKKKAEIVICIDEFQQISEFADPLTFQKKLRTVWQHQDNVTYCLFGSRRHMMEALFDTQTKPFYKFGDIMYLDCIPIPYWTEYIQRKFGSDGKSVSEDICKEICELVQLNSSYIQQLSWYLFQETEREADEDGLMRALEELISQNTPLFESRIEPLTAYQFNFLKAIAEGVSSGFTSSHVISKYKLGSSANVVALMKTLTTRDFIQEIDGVVSMTDPVMAMWIRRN